MFRSRFVVASSNEELNAQLPTDRAVEMAKAEFDPAALQEAVEGMVEELRSVYSS